MQTDLDKAIEYLPISWPDEEHGRPDRVSAMALKAMTQLYAASPLMQNDLNSIENKGYGKDMAAEAAVVRKRRLMLSKVTNITA